MFPVHGALDDVFLHMNAHAGLSLTGVSGWVSRTLMNLVIITRLVIVIESTA